MMSLTYTATRGTPAVDDETALEPEWDPFRDVDLDDPQQVARALARVGMRAGAEASVLRHMDKNIKETLAEFRRATAELSKLATRQELEDRVAELESKMDDRRRRDLWGLAVTLLLFAAIIGGFIAINRADIRRDEREDELFARRTEVVAICTRLEATEPAILSCIGERMKRYED